MNRRSFLTTATASALAPALFAGRASAEAALNYDALAALRAGLNESTSQVMSTASYMMDVLGPRLSGSPGIRKSAEWVVEKMKGYGLTGAELEPWPVDPTGTNNAFPRGWANTKFYLAATTPTAFPITGMSVAWTPGTKGLVSGECILVTETDEKELKDKYAGKLRGKWVLGQAPSVLSAQWDPVARRYTQEDLDKLEVPSRPPEKGAPAAPPPAARPPISSFNRNEWFFKEGALGVFSTSRGHGALGVQGGLRTDAPDAQCTRVAIEAEHYGRIARAVQLGQPVIVEADIKNEWYDNPEMFNVVGEIRGSELPNEVVIIGAHFDSWHAATGATDNGGPCSVALEAMRLLKSTNVPLKRTVRICLWNGEEQGLFGSRLYVAKHFGGVRGVPVAGNTRGNVAPITRDHSRFQAYFNLDNGGGSIRGIYAQGNNAIVPIFREWMEPLRNLGVTHVSPGSTGSTDHVSFHNAGLPGFQFIQDPLEYETKTHHTNLDFYEALQPEDMRRNSVILASFAMLAANHAGKLPRHQRPTTDATVPPPAAAPAAAAAPRTP